MANVKLALAETEVICLLVIPVDIILHDVSCIQLRLSLNMLFLYFFS